MNEDYAHLFGRKIDFTAFGKVVAAVMKRRGESQRKVGLLCRLDGKTVGVAAAGGRIDANSYLQLCLYTGANPFDALEEDPLGKGDVSQETPTSAPCETGEARAS
jgi:hypothetical protein